jgi:hypothetical protein
MHTLRMDSTTLWEDAPIVTVHAPACLRCYSEDYSRLKTIDNGDESKTKRVVCRRCGQRYLILIEPLPVSGNLEMDSAYTSGMIATRKDIVAIGRVASRLDTTVDKLADAARSIGVEAVETINGVPFLDASDVERLREALINQSPREPQSLKRGGKH